MSITAIAVIARAASKLRGLADFTETASPGASQVAVEETRLLAEGLEIILKDAQDVAGVGVCAPEDLVPHLRGLPAKSDESKTWIRQLRQRIDEATTFMVQAAESDDERKRCEETQRAVLGGFDRLLVEVASTDERVADRIATFVEKVAASQRRYLVAAEAPRVLVTVAHDIRNGAWRKP